MPGEALNELLASAKQGEIGANDSFLFNDALMQQEESKLNRIFVGSPVEKQGKIYFTVEGFDSQGDF